MDLISIVVLLGFIALITILLYRIIINWGFRINERMEQNKQIILLLLKIAQMMEKKEHEEKK